MTKRIARAIALFGTAGAIVIGGAGVAQASHGADDPVGHHHHHHHGHHHRNDDGPRHR
jgi:hypothetical protein